MGEKNKEEGGEGGERRQRRRSRRREKGSWNTLKGEVLSGGDMQISGVEEGLSRWTQA